MPKSHYYSVIYDRQKGLRKLDYIDGPYNSLALARRIAADRNKADDSGWRNRYVAKRIRAEDPMDTVYNPQRNPGALLRVRGRNWIQESYETGDPAIRQRTAALKKLGYRAKSESMGQQVTQWGRVKMTMVNIGPGTSGDEFLDNVPDNASGYPSGRANPRRRGLQYGWGVYWQDITSPYTPGDKDLVQWFSAAGPAKKLAKDYNEKLKREDSQGYYSGRAKQLTVKRAFAPDQMQIGETGNPGRLSFRGGGKYGMRQKHAGYRGHMIWQDWGFGLKWYTVDNTAQPRFNTPREAKAAVDAMVAAGIAFPGRPQENPSHRATKKKLRKLQPGTYKMTGYKKAMGQMLAQRHGGRYGKHVAIGNPFDYAVYKSKPYLQHLGTFATKREADDLVRKLPGGLREHQVQKVERKYSSLRHPRSSNPLPPNTYAAAAYEVKPGDIVTEPDGFMWTVLDSTHHAGKYTFTLAATHPTMTAPSTARPRLTVKRSATLRVYKP